MKGADKTTNSALLHYYKASLSKCNESSELDFFIKLPKENKVLKNKLGVWEADQTGDLMIVYQTRESDDYYPRSFEDAFIQENRSFICDHKNSFESLQSVKKFDEKDGTGKYVYDAFELANSCIKSKSSFALDILLNSTANGTSTFSNWEIPAYIKEGLLWLRKN